ncbi:MAG: mechanosensitive ion channel family protein, partial [Candidatus Cloacimonetes bacterium]|nr:mechanosensitive ion channel family protein [Candidatus Cloacimonadota bacterium]
MENLCFEQIWSKSLELIQHFGFKLIIAILILFFGKLVAKHLKKLTIKVMERHKTDKAIVTFTSSMLYGGLWVFVI